MPVITLFSGSYCNEKPVLQEIGCSNRLSADFGSGNHCRRQPSLQYTRKQDQARVFR